MTDYGPIFEKFRTIKNMPTKQVADGLVSPQFLRKFERGESDVSLTNLLLLLSRVHVTLDEFFQETDGTLDTWLNQIESDLETAVIARDSFLLKKIIKQLDYDYQETGDKKFLYFGLVAKRFYDILFYDVYDMAISPVMTYLRSNEEWGTMELYLSSYCYQEFSEEEALFYGLNLLKQKHASQSVNNWRWDVSLHFCLNLLVKHHLQKAKQILMSYREKVFMKNDLKNIHCNLFYVYLEGIYDLLNGKENDSEKVIMIFREVLKCEGYANQLDDTYEFFKTRARKLKDC
ncbi:hypothetical protein [Vagococcus acidifermentans]|uniref:HTH cro/C1-type domain-containing protein n=1 Tax=Vagococcus acidifermentans TaxID=564710 RepID=A0A430ALG1_9ENTE|nr:hypothetical protein [Vagococcus acidifermentans]RSU08939.1 hypothetical protein CBF27_13855 [Vagococcus acidifermentans]